jgi:hypothetical protein
MRIVLSTLLALFSLSAFAGAAADFSHMTGHFEGAGHWKDLSGNTGTYTETLDKSIVDDNTCQLTGTLNVNNQTFTWTSLVRKDANDLLSIFDKDNNPIGSGYCFPHHRDHSVTCHIDIATAEMTLEKTFHVEGDHFHAIGSKTVNGTKYMFNSHLARK